MSNSDVADLMRCLSPYPQHLQALTMELRSMVWKWYPKANELVYDNYNVLAFGWSITDRLSFTFCTMAVYSEYVHFGFYDGRSIKDPKRMLIGKGKQYRYILVKNLDTFPKVYMRTLVNESYKVASLKLFLAEERIKENKNKKITGHPQGMTIFKSISPKKTRPTKFLQ